MKTSTTQESLDRLIKYISNEDYKGYDPYDTLNSWVPLGIFGKWGPILATQFQKRNPINIRPLIGIKKEYNPKAMGLFLLTYSKLYKTHKNTDILNKTEYFYKWLINNHSKTKSGIGWGYNFLWASPIKLVNAFTPTAVVTGFVTRGLYEYYTISKDKAIHEIVRSAANFISNDLEWTKDETGVCISYSPLKRDICYNASLLAAEVLAINYKLNGDNQSKDNAVAAVNYVIDKQKSDGVWAYSVDLNSGSERMQIDFHQGYVLESIFNIINYLDIVNDDWGNSIKSGLQFYMNNQFSQDGRSYWRIPKIYPVDVHNQAQGIITFNSLSGYFPEGSNFAQNIADWTINNMQDKKGYFYYQKFRMHTNKISYMRWSQAWMFLALVTAQENSL